MKKALIGALVLIVLGIGAYVFIAQPAVQFSGDRVVTSSPASFSLRFTVLNATDAASLVVEIPAAARVAAYDTFGAKAGERAYAAGCFRMAVPPSGYLVIRKRRQ